MCGIAGYLRFDGEMVRANDVENILNRLAHRGRDGYHITLASRQSSTQHTDIGLGHRRLSIIDLHESASQPMYYADKELCVTYNGEIYNYLELRALLQEKNYDFSTQSDTEVLLAAYHCWGKDCVHYLNGMFAFALWDNRNKQLFCARDALGIKPFYYKWRTQAFAFASESQALVHLDDKTLNQDALHAYLLSMYVPHDVSIFAGIKKLPPGHTLTLCAQGQMVIERFWSPAEFKGVPADASNLEQLEYFIQAAVKKQLHSDVPVGGFLSGGVDSGLITALAAPNVSRFHTYSVGYEGLANNELPYARQIAERYETKHNELTLSSSEAMINLDKALLTMSEPLADSAMVATYMLSEMAAADGVKVLLNGTGGDEIFGGYTRYTGQLSLKRRLLLHLPQVLKRCIHFFPLNQKTKARLKHPALDMMFSTGGSYSLAANLSATPSAFSTYLEKLASAFSYSYKTLPLLYQHMLFDLHVYLPDELLFLLDQMTMAHTVEGRVPLLDIDVVQASFNFAADDHIQNGETKTLLKKIAIPYLSKEHVQRKKQGFAGSPRWWVQNHKEEFLAVISDVKQLPFFDDFNIDSLYQQSGSDSEANDIFILYCLCKWYDKIKRLH